MTDSATNRAFKRRVESAFNVVSSDYDSPALRAFVTGAQRLVALTAPGRGQRILDVATGTGNAAIAAARAVGPEGWVIGVDIASAMCAQARQNILAAGLHNVAIQAGDATALPFRDHTFDMVICASAIYTLPDIEQGLREWRRVLKPGGRVAFSSMGRGSDALYYKLLLKYGVRLPPVMPMQRVNTPEKCDELLREAGFVEIASHTEQLGYHLQNVEQFWDVVWNTGARIPLMYMPAEIVAQFKADFLAAVAASARGTSLWLDWPVIFSLGRKPTYSSEQIK